MLLRYSLKAHPCPAGCDVTVGRPRVRDDVTDGGGVAVGRHRLEVELEVEAGRQVAAAGVLDVGFRVTAEGCVSLLSSPVGLFTM